MRLETLEGSMLKARMRRIRGERLGSDANGMPVAHCVQEVEAGAAAQTRMQPSWSTTWRNIRNCDLLESDAKYSALPEAKLT